MSEFLSDVKYPRWRARQRLEQCPVTDGYKADPKKVIAIVALILVASVNSGAQRQEREATVAGRDVTIQVTVHPLKLGRIFSVEIGRRVYGERPLCLLWRNRRDSL
jgi:hypothetical protein